MGAAFSVCLIIEFFLKSENVDYWVFMLFRMDVLSLLSLKICSRPHLKSNLFCFQIFKCSLVSTNKIPEYAKVFRKVYECDLLVSLHMGTMNFWKVLLDQLCAVKYFGFLLRAIKMGGF